MPLLSVSQRSTIEMNLSPFFAVRELYAIWVLGLYSFMMSYLLQWLRVVDAGLRPLGLISA